MSLHTDPVDPLFHHLQNEDHSGFEALYRSDLSLESRQIEDWKVVRSKTTNSSNKNSNENRTETHFLFFCAAPCDDSSGMLRGERSCKDGLLTTGPLSDRPKCPNNVGV